MDGHIAAGHYMITWLWVYRNHGFRCKSIGLQARVARMLLDLRFLVVGRVEGLVHKGPTRSTFWKKTGGSGFCQCLRRGAAQAANSDEQSKL